MEPDDVAMADIAGQALDIFLHGPESAHKNGIVKTFTHTSIPIYQCNLQRNKEQNHQLTNMTASFSCLFLSIVVVGDGQEAWHLLFA